jgi:predicted nucleic acid-binding protein
MMLVVDASVVIKWYVPEVHQDQAIAVLNGNEVLAAPELLIAETANIVWKKVRLKEIAVKDGLDIIKAFVRAQERIQFTPSIDLVLLAYDIARNYDRSVYDCVYVALAALHQCQLVTADRKLFNSLQKSPFALNLLWIADLQL